MRLYEKRQAMRRKRIPVRIVICKSRRAGLSTGVEAFIYDDTTTHENTDSLIVANELNPSENVLGMCIRFWQNTPEFITIHGTRIDLRPKIPPQFNNNPSKDRLIFDKPLNSRIFVATAKSIDAYLSFGFQNIHATEASRYADAKELFRALYPTLSDDAHSALYIESTPNGQEGKGAWFHEQVMMANGLKRSEYGTAELVFVPWQEMVHSFSIPFGSDEKKQKFIRSFNASERDVMKRLPQVSAEQMQWRRMMLNGPAFNADEELFDQEYPTDLATAFLLTGHSVFGRKAIKRLMARKRDPIWMGDIYWGESDNANLNTSTHRAVRHPKFLTKGQAQASGFRPHENDGRYNNLKVWRWPKAGDRLFIGADIGGGNPETKNGDLSTACVMALNEFEKHEMIMSWAGRLNPIAFSEVLSALAWALRIKVGENAVAPVLAPEFTGPGKAVINNIDHLNLYPNLYRYQAPGVKGMPQTKHLGWESNQNTKPIMVAYTLRMVDKDMIDIPDEDTILEMSSYMQTDPFGDERSYGGRPGAHDDRVTALQIAATILRFAEVPIPGESMEHEVDMMAEDPNSPVWDPFTAQVPLLGLPGLTDYDVDAEALEEALFYTY
jgi:hypothetical protein